MIMEPFNGSGGFNASRGLVLLQEGIEFHGHHDLTANTIITMQSGQKAAFPVHGLPIKITEVAAIEKLRSQIDPACFLYLVNKGQVGINIENLCNFMSFKKTDKKTINGVSICISPEQLIGRLLRIWIPSITKDIFANVYNYDIENYVKDNNDHDSISNLLLSNSFDLYVPNNDMWNVAIEDVLDRYVSTTNQAAAWINSIK